MEEQNEKKEEEIVMDVIPQDQQLPDMIQSTTTTKNKKKLSKKQEKILKNKKKQEQIEKEQKLNLKGDDERLGEHDDPIYFDSNRYALISYVHPNGRQKMVQNGCIVKIRACSDSIEKLEKYASELIKIDPDFDIFIVDMGKWVPIPFPPDAFEQQRMIYQDPKIANIMDGYYKQAEMNKKSIEKRLQLAKSKVEKENRKIKKKQQQREEKK